MEACSGIGMKQGEWEDMPVKHDIAENIHPAIRGIKTFETLVQVAIAKEDTQFGSNSNFLELYGLRFGHTTHPNVRRIV
jgi:hypothetical protein